MPYQSQAKRISQWLGNVPIDVELGEQALPAFEPLGSGCRIREGEQRHDESYHDLTDDAVAEP
jgi:hypothetical protein